MRGGHGGGGLGGELADLGGGDALVDAGAYLLRDEDGVAVLHAEAVAEFLDPSGDLVEVDRLLPAVALHHVHLPPAGVGSHRGRRSNGQVVLAWGSGREGFGRSGGERRGLAARGLKKNW